MSFYRSNKTLFRNQECLAGALRKNFSVVEVHATPQQLHGYQTEASKKGAEIIVRKQEHKGHYDIGFQKQTDGTFAALIADDERHLGQAWMAKLAMTYAEEQSNEVAAEQGCELEGREVLGNGAIKLRYAVSGGF
jgi:hypothetical protein